MIINWVQRPMKFTDGLEMGWMGWDHSTTASEPITVLIQPVSVYNYFAHNKLKWFYKIHACQARKPGGKKSLSKGLPLEISKKNSIKLKYCYLNR